MSPAIGSFEWKLDCAPPAQRMRFEEKVAPLLVRFLGRELNEKEKSLALWMSGQEPETHDEFIRMVAAAHAAGRVSGTADALDGRHITGVGDGN